MLKIRRFLCVLLSLLTGPASAGPSVNDSSMRDSVGAFSPPLLTLYERHSVLLPTLQRYVVQQGFSEPHEQAAVIAHELIHIESARLGAFWISGQGFDGYLASDWPPTVGRDLQLTGAEKAQLGVLYESYLLRNPATTLSNVLDELNAYSQTAGFVCLHFPAGAAKQTGPLLGHLALANAFLKASPPRDLKTTCARTTTKGALALIVGNSYKALSSCNTFSVPNQDAIRACLE